MIKSLGIAILACLVMFGANFGVGAYLKSRSALPPPTEQSLGSDSRKTKELSVPIIRDGGVKGYVVLQLNYVVDLAVAKTLPVPPDAFVIDEAFRFIYEDNTIDFTHLDKLELEKLTRTLMYRVNTRMKAEVITDMGVQECNFLVNAEALVESKLDKLPKP